MHYMFLCLYDPDMKMPLPLEAFVEADTPEEAYDKLEANGYYPVKSTIIFNSLETPCVPEGVAKGLSKVYNADTCECTSCSSKENKRIYLKFSDINNLLKFVTMGSTTGCVKYIPKEGEAQRLERPNIKDDIQAKASEVAKEINAEKEQADRDFLSELGIGS